MERFAFIIHPLEAKKDIARKYPFVKYLPESLVEWGMKYKSPMTVSHITGVKSAVGTEAEGWFIGMPLTPKLMLSMPIDQVWEKIIKCGKIAEELGAGIIGLGAFTSVVGDGGITVSQNLNIAVTTGNSYTVATAIEGAIKAARMMDIDPAEASVAIVGAAGSIGRTCAQAFADTSASVTLVGRNVDKLEQTAQSIGNDKKASIRISTDIREGIQNADIVISVSSAVDAIVEPSFIKSGAVVCDVARPRDVSQRVVKERNDVLVIEGGVVAVPGDVNFNFNFGFPPQTAYACMSETMMLSLDRRYESFTLGKEVSLEQVRTISGIAQKHGFKIAGFRSFEKAVSPEAIETIKKNVKSKCC